MSAPPTRPGESHRPPLGLDRALTWLARRRSRQILLALAGSKRTAIELKFMLGMREHALRRELRGLVRVGLILESRGRRSTYEQSPRIRISRIGSRTRISYTDSMGGELSIDSSLRE